MNREQIEYEAVMAAHLEAMEAFDAGPSKETALALILATEKTLPWDRHHIAYACLVARLKGWLVESTARESPLS